MRLSKEQLLGEKRKELELLLSTNSCDSNWRIYTQVLSGGGLVAVLNTYLPTTTPSTSPIRESGIWNLHKYSTDF